MSGPLHWGILGTGTIAASFANDLATVPEHGIVTAVGSRSAEKSAVFCHTHGGRAHGSYEAVIADPVVDSVYIALPNHLHAEWAIAAARAGKRILCEKPACLEAEELARVLAACAENQVLFMEGFSYRCHPRWQRLRELIADDAIGPIRHVLAHFGVTGKQEADIRDRRDWGGGVLMDLGVYALSLCRLIAGEPSAIHALASMPADSEVDRQGGFQYRTDAGVIACGLYGQRSQQPFTASVHGERGWIEIRDPWTFCGDPTFVVHDHQGRREEILCECPYGYLAKEAVHISEHRDRCEVPAMDWTDSRNQAAALDRLRASIGLDFAR